MSSIVLDPSKYKKTKVSRGFTYNYFYSPAREGKFTLLLAHGFPSASADWAGVVAILEPEGYGFIVPDMLGYAGTDKPTNFAFYVGTGVARDLNDLVEAEGVKKAVAIGHDWGAYTVSRIANQQDEKFLAYGFITVGYIPPDVHAGMQESMEKLAKELGLDTMLGYFPFFATQAKYIEQRMDSFMDLTFASDLTVYRDHVCPAGATQAWLEADRRCEKISSPVVTPEWVATRHKLLASNMTSPTCWYKVQASSATRADNQTIPKEAHIINKPVFFGACTHDAPSPPIIGDLGIQAGVKGPVTRREYETGHWIILTHYEQLAKDLSAWLKELSIE